MPITRAELYHVGNFWYVAEEKRDTRYTSREIAVAYLVSRKWEQLSTDHTLGKESWGVWLDK